MATYGLLIDTEWCTGCHTCEIACQMEHKLPEGQTGILVQEIGPWEIGEGKWQLSYLPTLTSQCTSCAERVAKGRLPTCVQHCQARCMEHGPVEELAKKMEGSNKALFTI